MSPYLVILPIRLIGFPPWELVNYVSGLSKISYRDYITATMIGIFPAIVITILIILVKPYIFTKAFNMVKEKENIAKELAWRLETWAQTRRKRQAARRD